MIHTVEAFDHRLNVVISPGIGDLPPGSALPVINCDIKDDDLFSAINGPGFGGHPVDLSAVGLAAMGIDFKKEQEAIREEERFRVKQRAKLNEEMTVAVPQDASEVIAERVKSIYDKAHAEVRAVSTDYAVVLDREGNNGRVALPILPLSDTYDTAMDRAAKFNMTLWHLSPTECVALSDLLKRCLGYGSRPGDRVFQNLIVPIPVEPNPKV